MGAWAGCSPLPVTSPLTERGAELFFSYKEERPAGTGSLPGRKGGSQTVKQPMGDRSGWKGHRAGCHGPDIPLGPETGSEGSETLHPRGLGESEEAW